MMKNGDHLSPEHLAMLSASAIGDDVISARGYRTVTDADELRSRGFAPAQCRVPGLLLPLWTTDGENGLFIYRPDNPRVVESRRKGKLPDGTYPNRVLKYEAPKGLGTRLDCPPPCRSMLGNPSTTLWITEGQKKADSLATLGLCAVALLGVWNFKGKNSAGGTTFLADWDYVALRDRGARLVFDSDYSMKSEVRQALDRLTEHLQRKGANVSVVYLPNGPGGEKWGVDDYLAAGHTLQDLEALVQAPRPAPQAAPDVIELLDAAPDTMRRPLALLGGRCYAATWLYAKVTRRETLTSKGEVIRHNPPIEIKEQRLFVVRDDGAIFGDGGHKSLGELGVDVHLPEIPPSDRTWSTAGVRAYAAGNRPDPAGVFGRLVDVVDRFIDFDRSLADQRTMSELVGCYILSTWFLDAFQVIGFLWPNGDRGSGKTHLLLVVTELAYLGQLILAGGSFASLRDLADYGACLGFDDAENMNDPRKTDPDKRALLLAGNRRGATVPLKELAGDKKWVTRYVNAFCPRLFSAIRLPDAILASRTIIIPLIRTPDRYRANVDPLDYTVWPHDRRELIDDLWALAVSNTKKITAWDSKVEKGSRLAGRALQPWRAILAVAGWLDASGVSGLWKRMEALSVDYQSERVDLEVSDYTALAIRAMIEYAVANVANETNVANHIETPKAYEFTTSALAEIAHQIASDSDGDLDPEKVTSQRLGHVLRKMRLTKPPRPSGQRLRIWRITHGDLLKWATAYGIVTPHELMEENSIKIDRYSTHPNVGNIGDPSPNIGNIGEIGNIGYTPDDLLEGEL